MRGLLLTLLLLFTSTTEASVYGNLDPCIVDRETEHMTCLESATPDEVSAWVDYHLNESVLDDGEKEGLALYKATAFTDLGTTAIGLLGCVAVVEANPIGILIPLGKYLHYKKLEKEAKRTSRYHSMATGIKLSAVPAGFATGWNISILAKCL